MTATAAKRGGWGRLLIYALFGPLFGAFAVFAFMLIVELFSPRSGGTSAGLGALIFGPLIVAPFAYIIGLLPALAVGLFDRWLWKRHSTMYAHLSAVTLAGFAVCFLLVVISAQSLRAPALMGAVGAFAAIACYLLTSLFRKPARG